MNAISANYRELRPDEVEQVAKDCANAWQDPEIPRRQYELAVKPELDNYGNGKPVAPFDALVKCLRKLPAGCLVSTPSLLDIGASGGYYSEVLKIAGFYFQYTGCDFSRAFSDLADELYPGIDFDVADARKLPYSDNSFPIVLNGAVLMHCREYDQVIRETARVTSKYAIFHRTPVVIGSETKYFEKEGYGCRMLEIHFNEADLLKHFDACGLELLHTECVFWNAAEHFGHRSYLLAKKSVGEQEWERA